MCAVYDACKIVWNKMRYGEPIEMILIVNKYVHTFANFLNIVI